MYEYWYLTNAFAIVLVVVVVVVVVQTVRIHSYSSQIRSCT